MFKCAMCQKVFDDSDKNSIKAKQYTQDYMSGEVTLGLEDVEVFVCSSCFKHVQDKMNEKIMVSSSAADDEKETCMYCAEKGITNDDVYIDIIDRDLGPGKVCRNCYEEVLEEENQFYKELLLDIKSALDKGDTKEALSIISSLE